MADGPPRTTFMIRSPSAATSSAVADDVTTSPITGVLGADDCLVAAGFGLPNHPPDLGASLPVLSFTDLEAFTGPLSCSFTLPSLPFFLSLLSIDEGIVSQPLNRRWRFM